MKRLLCGLLLAVTFLPVTPATAAETPGPGCGGRSSDQVLSANLIPEQPTPKLAPLACVLPGPFALMTCPVLAALAGSYGPYYVGSDGEVYQMSVLVINAQGDVFLAGEPLWDCPPYDLFD